MSDNRRNQQHNYVDEQLNKSNNDFETAAQKALNGSKVYLTEQGLEKQQKLCSVESYDPESLNPWINESMDD